jgi:hypothetical protein
MKSSHIVYEPIRLHDIVFGSLKNFRPKNARIMFAIYIVYEPIRLHDIILGSLKNFRPKNARIMFAIFNQIR